MDLLKRSHDRIPYALYGPLEPDHAECWKSKIKMRFIIWGNLALQVLYFIYRFWYGGAEGNDNRFDDKKICDETCVDPIGREACELPRVSGPCDGHFPR